MEVMSFALTVILWLPKLPDIKGRKLRHVFTVRYWQLPCAALRGLLCDHVKRCTELPISGTKMAANAEAYDPYRQTSWTKMRVIQFYRVSVIECKVLEQTLLFILWINFTVQHKAYTTIISKDPASRDNLVWPRTGRSRSLSAILKPRII
jgi:hypothetical protein